MGVAVYVVLDNKAPGFDTLVDGKTVAKEGKKLNAISRKLGLPTFDQFVSMSTDDLQDLLGADLDMPEQDVKWFSAQEGLDYVDTLMGHIQTVPASVRDAEGVLGDLADYRKVLAQASDAGMLWRLNIDIQEPAGTGTALRQESSGAIASA